MAEYLRRCALCLVQEKEVAPFLQTLKKTHPEVEMAIFSAPGALHLLFQGETPLDPVVEAVKKKYPTFYYGEGKIEEALSQEFITRKKTLALAESCTGGALSAQLVALAGASQYLLGSIVAYSNGWKERFLQVSHTTLMTKGAVSREVVSEMVAGLFAETDADFTAAISGVAGPTPAGSKLAVETICIAIGERGQKVDAGIIQAPPERHAAIELAVHLTLGALWRRLVHKEASFS